MCPPDVEKAALSGLGKSNSGEEKKMKVPIYGLRMNDRGERIKSECAEARELEFAQS